MEIIRKLISILLAGALLAGFFCGQMKAESVQAARTEEISENSQIIYFEDGSSLTVESDEETMTITGTHVKSSARISYSTTGYNMTLEETGGYVEGKEYRKIKLLDKYETITDEVTTSYVLDRQSVVDGAYALFKKKHPEYDSNKVWMEFVKEVSERGGIEFYLHNIFAVIERTGGSGSTVTATSKSYNNLGTAVGVSPKVPGILNAVEELYGSDWGEGTKKKLPEYYDIHLKLYVKTTKTTVIFATEDGEVVWDTQMQVPVYMNAQVQLWFNLKNTLVIGEDTYRITQASVRKSFVHYENAAAPAQFYSLSDKNGLKISLNTGEVSFRQLKEEPSTVVIICEKAKPDLVEKPPDEITESGEIWRIQAMEPENMLAISAWEAENPCFDVESEAGGIPVNEKLIVNGKIWKYLIEAEFEAKNGEIIFQVPVRKKYRLVWQEIVDIIDEEPVYQSFEEIQEVEVYVPVVRKYSYAQLNSLNYCRLAELCVENTALPDGKQNGVYGTGMLADITFPELSYKHYEGEEAHLQYPTEVEAGIELPMLTLYGNQSIPSIPAEDFTAQVEAQISGIKVRSDAFSFDGIVYLNEEWIEFEPGMEISLNQLFSGLRDKDVTALVCSEPLLIPEKTENGMYESIGQIKYVQHAAFPDTAGAEEYEFWLADVNGVYVYTPVYCAAQFLSDNKKYTQLDAPQDNAVQLVLDPTGNTSEIWLGISNTGFHSQRNGYGERDYVRTLTSPGLSYLGRSENGVLRNEVCFPFDVFRDTGLLYGSADDTYIPAGSWVAIGLEMARFYLPEWVYEGIYTVECRSVAVSCPDDTENGEQEANRQEENYIATDSLTVQVSGRICGLCLYDIADYPLWEDVFRDSGTGRIKNRYENRRDGTVLSVFDSAALYRYYSGLADSCGNKRVGGEQYILPVLAGGHPTREKEMVKAGYTLRFMVTTIGDRMSRQDSHIRVLPRFFWVDENGENRREVDLYYTKRLADGRKYLAKIGEEEDSDIKMQTAGSIWLGIPEAEMQAAEKIWGGIEKEEEVPMYSYSRIDGSRFFRTVKNFSYRDYIMGKAQYPLINGRGVSEEKLLSLEQGNYFEYSLPYDVMAAEKDFAVKEYAADYGIDFTEDFWKKEGFLIVSFEIAAIVQERVYFNYDNTVKNGAEYCNMWELEAMQKQRRDKNEVSFRFYPGDVLVLPVMDSIKKDHWSAGIY